MDALITLIAAPVAAEALRIWGAFAICLLMLGGGCWILWASLRAERTGRQAERIAGEATEQRLQAEISRLQELRLQDAQRVIDVARSGTATMAARTEGDARMQELMAFLVAGMTRAGLVQPPPALQLPPTLPDRSP